MARLPIRLPWFIIPRHEFFRSPAALHYQHTIATGRAPKVAAAAAALSATLEETRAAYRQLSESHTIMLQEESGELWRVAPFSAIPTAFPVTVAGRLYYANCVWDALGIPAVLGQDACIDAACGCCNESMPLHVRDAALLDRHGVIHIAVPARDWYKDVVFT